MKSSHLDHIDLGLSQGQVLMPIHHIPLTLILASLLYISKIQIRPSLNKRYSWNTKIKHITQTDQAHIHADKTFKKDRCNNDNFKCNGGNPVRLWDKNNKETKCRPRDGKQIKEKEKEGTISFREAGYSFRCPVPILVETVLCRI